MLVWEVARLRGVLFTEDELFTDLQLILEEKQWKSYLIGLD